MYFVIKSDVLHPMDRSVVFAGGDVIPVEDLITVSDSIGFDYIDGTFCLTKQAVDHVLKELQK